MPTKESVIEFFAAIRAGDVNLVKSLLASDPALASARNQSGVSAILASVYSGRKDIGDLLFAHEPHLDLADAAAVGQLSEVQEMVDANPALAGSFSPDGFPVVALAAVFGHLDVAQYLAAKDADINAVATNGTGYNALTGSVAGGHLEIVKWLLESGASANYKYGAGHTPLLTAAANGHLDIVKLLLAHGADPGARANDGKSAIAFAMERNHTAIVDYLRNLAP